MSSDPEVLRWILVTVALASVHALDAAWVAKLNGRNWKWGLLAAVIGPFAILVVGLAFPLADHLKSGKGSWKKSWSLVAVALLVFSGFLLLWFGVEISDPRPVCLVFGPCRGEPFSASPGTFLIAAGVLISLTPPALLALEGRRPG